MMYTILLTIVTTMVILVYIKKTFYSNKNEYKIPGPTGLPFIGNALQIKPSGIYEQFDALAKKYGKVFQLKVFGTNVVVLNSVDMINNAFVKNGHIFNERQYLFIANRIGLLKSVSFNYFNKEHDIARKAFVKSLRMYGSGIAKFENIVQNELKRIVKKIDTYDGKEFEVVQLIRRSIVNTISILLIGEEATDEHVKLFFELTSGEDFFLNAATNTILSNMPFLFHLPYYKRRMQTVIEAKRVLLKKYVLDVQNGVVDKEKVCFVNRLFQCQGQDTGEESAITDEMIKAMCITDVLTAGVLTTSATLMNSILCLVNHPEYQTRIQEEVDAVFGSEKDPSVTEKHACSFTQAVVLETMRYIPTTPFSLPHACKIETNLAGYHIKANSQVLPNIWTIHHDESIWGDPWTFRPERFLDKEGNLVPNDHIFMRSESEYSILIDENKDYIFTKAESVKREGCTSTYERRTVFTSTCSMNVKYYPFDRQTCNAELVAWGYSPDEVTMAGGDLGIVTDEYENNTQWNLVRRSWDVVSGLNDVTIRYTMVLEREPTYVLFTVLLPVLLLTTLNIFVFILPCGSGERVGYAITVFLSFAVFFTLISGVLPESVAIFTVYVILMTAQSALICIIAIIEVRLSANDDNKYPVPKWLVGASSVGHCKCFGMLIRHKKISSNNETPVETFNHTVKTLSVEDMKQHDAGDNKEIAERVNEETWRHAISGLDWILAFFFTLISILITSISIGICATA